MTTTRVSVRIQAPPDRVYRALIDPNAVKMWMVPDGMKSTIHEFEPREGGVFRISLSYDDPTGTGKTTSQTDTYHGRFEALVRGQAVVQTVEFETADPSLQGQMTISITLSSTGEGTELEAIHRDLPPGLSAEQNEIGWRMSLEKLVRMIESESTGSD